MSDNIAPWLADGDPVLLDEGFIATALPTRAHPPRDLPAPDWQAAMDTLARNRDALDLDQTEPAIRATIVSAWNRTSGSYPRAERAVLLTSARAARDTHDAAAQLLHAIAAEDGLVEAVHTMIDSLQIGFTNVYCGREIGMRFYLHTQSGADRGGADPLYADFEMLRRLACIASDAEYDEVVATVRDAARHLSAVPRVALALALPDAPDLSNELIAELAGSDATAISWLQATATDPELVDRARKRIEYWGIEYSPRHVNALTLTHGSASVHTLAPHADYDAAGAALVRIGLPESIRALAGVASAAKANQMRLVAAVDHWPAAAAAGLAEVVGDGGRETSTCRVLLAGLVAKRPDVVDTVLPWVSGGAGSALRSVVDQVHGEVDEAMPDELPPVLASPPWLRPTPKSSHVEGLEPLPLAPAVHWRDGQREEWSKYPHTASPRDHSVAGVAAAMCNEYRGWSSTGPVPPELQQNVVAALHAGDVDAAVTAFHAWAQGYRAVCRWSSAPVNGFLLCAGGVEILDTVSPGFGLRLWNALAGTTDSDESVPYVMAHHGVAALPGFVSVVRRRPTEYLSYALVFGDVELAPLVARAYRTSKTLREEADAWLRAHPEHAAAGLIPAAIGKPGEAKDNAATTLRALAAHGARELILSVAARYQRDDVAAAVTAMLDEDPTDLYPTKRPKLPAFWSPESWRRPKVLSGKVLPLDAVGHLGTMLTFPTADGRYAGIDHVVAACTAESLADFGWDLFSAWLAAGGPSKDSWAMTSLGFFGDDDTARRFTPLVRAWPGESQHKRAVTGLDVLAGIGSDVALMLLNGIANKVKFKALQERAREKIAQIADDRGLTTDELADRLAPDLGLEADGTMLLDFGPRQFLVGFDEALKPFVRDTDGARLKELPKPRATDDAELAKAATAQWRTLKKDARTVAGQQVLRLELAMCTRRRWDLPVFEQFLAGHPLVRHLVRRLVWAVYTDTGEFDRCFRVAEDGQYTDADDDALTLPANAVIGLPHALELADADASAFSQLFTDYELLQPFTQLGRDTYQLTEAEKNSDELTRWKDLVVPTGKILGLTNRGWERGTPLDAGVVGEVEKSLAGGWRAIGELSEGIATGAIDVFPEQSVTRVTVGIPGRWGLGEKHTFGELDNITASELIRDLEGLRG